MGMTVIRMRLLVYLVILVAGARSHTHGFLNLCCPLILTGQVSSFSCANESQLLVTNGSNSSVWWISPGYVVSPEQNASYSFYLKYKPMECDAVSEEIIPLEKQLRTLQSANFTKDGYFRVKNEFSEFFHNQEYCVDGIDDKSVKVRYCDSNCWKKVSSNGKAIDKSDRRGGAGTACVRKCCDLGKSFKLVTVNGVPRSMCVPTGEPFNPKLYSGNYNPLTKPMKLHVRRASSSSLNCTVGAEKVISSLSKENAKSLGWSGNLCFRVMTNGDFYYQDGKGIYRSLLPPDAYCIDRMQNFQELNPSPDSWLEFVAVTCSLPPEKSEDSTRKLYGGLLFCSSLFLLLTFLVYLLLWDHHGLHGWTTLGHSGSMFMMYLFLGTSHILSVSKDMSTPKTLSCVVVGVLAHFFFIATFCWLTLISFDLWFTFRSAFNPNSASKRIKRFIFYVLFGWGLPAIVVVTSLILDKQYEDVDCPDAILPLYGVKSCFVNPIALGEYLYYPIAALLILNLLFFGVTTWKLYQYKQSTRIATNNLENKRQFFKLFLKLFCVMGITWMFEVISWLHVGTHATWYYQIIDAVNVCQAIAIFAIYVCKKETVLALEKRYPSLKVILDPFIRLFKCRQTPMDAEQSSSLNSSMRHDKTRTSVMSKYSSQRVSNPTSRTSSTVVSDT